MDVKFILASPSMATIVEIATTKTARNSVSTSATVSAAKRTSANVLPTHDANFSSNIQLWAFISTILWWKVLIISAISIVILCHTLMLMRRYRRSNYFHFLVFMIILHLIMLMSIMFALLSERTFSFRGDMTCRLSTFVANVTSCYINWLWVMMYMQRFIHVFYPMRCMKADYGTLIFRIIDDTRKVILLTGIMAVMAQLWTPFLMKENLAYSKTSMELQGSYCGPDPDIIDPRLYKWISVVESLWTYGIPCLITVFADVAVLVFRHDSKRFTTICTEQIANHSATRQLSNGRRANESRCQQAVIGTKGTFRSTKINARQIFDVTKVAKTTESDSRSRSNGEEEDVRGRDVESNGSNGHYNYAESEIICLLPDTTANNQSVAQEDALLASPRQRYPNDEIDKDEIATIVESPKRQPQRGRTWPNSKRRFLPLGKTVHTNSIICAMNATHTLRSKSISVPIKIQSEESLRSIHQRRQYAIRRCLIMASMQLSLNLPLHVLQLVDEFSGLRKTSEWFDKFYLLADAFFYLLYLSQYPLMAIYVRWLHSGAPSGVGNISAASSTAGVQVSSRSNIHANDASHFNGVSLRSSSSTVTTTTESRRRRISTHTHPLCVTTDDTQEAVVTIEKSSLSAKESAIGDNLDEANMRHNSVASKRHSPNGTRLHSECKPSGT